MAGRTIIGRRLSLPGSGEADALLADLAAVEREYRACQRMGLTGTGPKYARKRLQIVVKALRRGTLVPASSVRWLLGTLSAIAKGADANKALGLVGPMGRPPNPEHGREIFDAINSIAPVGLSGRRESGAFAKAVQQVARKRGMSAAAVTKALRRYERALREKGR
jgi:hypothetical protein